MITKKGVVTKISGEKTIKVEVQAYHTHPKYKKRYRMTTSFLAHDEKAEAKVGDTVVITQTRPVSKRKAWVLSSLEK